MELKSKYSLSMPVSSYRSNRTFMELKLYPPIRVITHFRGSNRTFMELKLHAQTSEIHGDTMF